MGTAKYEFGFEGYPTSKPVKIEVNEERVKSLRTQSEVIKKALPILFGLFGLALLSLMSSFFFDLKQTLLNTIGSATVLCALTGFALSWYLSHLSEKIYKLETIVLPDYHVCYSPLPTQSFYYELRKKIESLNDKIIEPALTNEEFEALKVLHETNERIYRALETVRITDPSKVEKEAKRLDNSSIYYQKIVRSWWRRVEYTKETEALLELSKEDANESVNSDLTRIKVETLDGRG